MNHRLEAMLLTFLTMLAPGWVVAQSSQGVCVLTPGGSTRCCDEDGDYVTPLCLGQNGVFMLELWCLDQPDLTCGEGGLSCFSFETADGSTLRVCLVPPDCADADPSRYPEVTGHLEPEEMCDGKDNDCNGLVDEAFDLDEDGVTSDCGSGYGYFVGSPQTSCDPSTGDVSSQDDCRVSPDCDDLASAVYPPNPADVEGALEVCNGQDDNCEGQIDEGLDKDGDGFTSCGGDCDDQDPGRHPDAVEIAGDGVDQNCDGLELCFSDLDGDGYRSSDELTLETTDLSCTEIGLGSLDVPGGDCDDLDAFVHPEAAEEVADGIDQDCDGLELCLTDADEDGFRPDSPTVVSSSELMCEGAGEATYAIPSGDCDDSDPLRSPGAEEGVGDGVDQDCDGEELCFADADGDGYRPDAASTTISIDLLCDGEGEALPASPLGDCDDQDASRNPGAEEIAGDEVDQNCDGQEICYVDEDGDGQRPEAESLQVSSDEDCADPLEAALSAPITDCNDLEPTVYSGAREVIADGVDEDCDGQELCAVDGDGDGFRLGAEVTVTSSDLDCSDPGEAYLAASSGDCDDENASSYPGAVERTGDEVDSNCDGQEVCYQDLDGDGYRPNSSPTQVSADSDCGDLLEASANAPLGDCNDGNATIHPGASEQVADSVDQNCDGLELCAVDKDDDGYRSSAGETVASSDLDCGDSGEALPSEPVGDCDDSDPLRYPGASERVADEVDQNCDGGEICYLDEDRDGYASALGTTLESVDEDCGDPKEVSAGGERGDCNDNNSVIYPGALEVCDSKDNDCDTVVDEGWDVDGDGVTQCGRDGDLSTVADNDCVDTNPGISPEEEERCDGVDQNCNGEIDEGSGGDAVTWWIDQDGDGYGAPSSQQVSCTRPAGYVPAPDDPQEEDCNDFDPRVFPGAENERLDGSDSNCDGRIPLLELDCDDDGQLPISRQVLAAIQSGSQGESGVELSCGGEDAFPGLSVGELNEDAVPNDALYTASSLNLTPCRLGDVPPALTCLGLSSPRDFSLLCDDPAYGGSGLWLVDNYTEVKNLFDANRGGIAASQCDGRFMDCDDQRSDVCGCRAEICDGRDSNCATDGYNLLDLAAFDDDEGGDGVPDAMQPLAERSGAISLKELDADADGVLLCTASVSLDSFVDDGHPWSGTGQALAFKYDDCNDLCALQQQDAEELCDGIANNACATGTDTASFDPNLESGLEAARCGYLSDNVQIDGDAIYVVLLDACPGCQDPEALRYLPLTPLRATLPYPSEADADCENDARSCVETDLTAMGLEAALQRVASFMSPSGGGLPCVPEGLSRVELAPNPSLELLRLCLPDPSTGEDASSRCHVVRLLLNEATEENISTLYPEVLEGDKPLCQSSYAARALWPADRIRAARDVVSLWHCIRSGQCECQREDGSTGPVYADCPTIVATPRGRFTRVSNDLDSDFPLTRMGAPVDVGALLDPEFDGFSGWLHGCFDESSSVGGGCEGGSRDTVEGPRDIYGRLTGMAGSCESCADGLDNNCNGFSDEDEPGCYPCLQGQGMSCSCRRDLGTPASGAAGGFFALPLLLLTGGLVRRRRS